MYKFYTAQTTTGVSSAAITPKRDIPAEGVGMEFFAFGTFGGATVKLQQSPDGGTTWFDLVSVSAAGRTAVTVYSGLQLRVNISGGTGISISAWLTNSGNV